MKKLDLVRVRAGKRSLHWPGLLAGVLVTTAVVLAVGWAFDEILWPEEPRRFERALVRSLIPAVVLTAFFARQVWNKLGAAPAERERAPRT